MKSKREQISTTVLVCNLIMIPLYYIFCIFVNFINPPIPLDLQQTAVKAAVIPCSATLTAGMLLSVNMIKGKRWSNFWLLTAYMISLISFTVGMEIGLVMQKNS